MSSNKDSNQKNICYVCSGSGKVHVVLQRPCQHCAFSSGRSRTTFGAPCSWCAGKGWIPEERLAVCLYCNGTGQR